MAEIIYNRDYYTRSSQPPAVGTTISGRSKRVKYLYFLGRMGGGRTEP